MAQGLPGVYENGDDGTALGMVKIMMVAPDADRLEAGFHQSPDYLLPGGSWEFHNLVLPVLRDTETSTGIGFPSLLATSIYPEIASSICARASA